MNAQFLLGSVPYRFPPAFQKVENHQFYFSNLMIQKELPDWYYNCVCSCPAGATAVCDLVFAM